jgi:hypothetical protein
MDFFKNVFNVKVCVGFYIAFLLKVRKEEWLLIFFLKMENEEVFMELHLGNRSALHTFCYFVCFDCVIGGVFSFLLHWHESMKMRINLLN